MPSPPVIERNPAEVFTPTQAVRRDMFASRDYKRLQERFVEKLAEPGRQIVLYGDTGVGKTSLVDYIVEDQGLRMVYIECGADFESMMKEALASAGVTEQVAETIENTKVGAGVAATLAGLFKASASWDRTKTTTGRSYPVSLQRAAREALDVQGIDVLFLDNFENLHPRPHYDDTVLEIVQLMKSFSGKGTQVKCIVAGIPKESEKLINLDPATGRRISQIEVPRMPDTELDQILTNGERVLGITFEGFARAQIIEKSDGFPHYTHLHALHSVRQAFRENTTLVTLQHFEAAITSILEDADLTLREGYREATETTGTVKVRKSVLEAIALTRKQEVTFREIKKSFWTLHPRYESLDKLDFINPHLGDLVDKYHVLQSRGLAKSADRTYRFAIR